MKYSFDELASARDVIGVFYIFLIDMPFSYYYKMQEETEAIG